MTSKNSTTDRQRLKYLTLRFFFQFSKKVQKLLLLQLTLSRAAIFKTLLGVVLISQLTLQAVLADGFVFVAYNPLTGVTADNYSHPTFVDIDGDGDFDVFVGGEDGVHFYANTGAAQNPNFGADQLNPFGLPDFEDKNIGPGYALDCVDIDNDNDQDMFIGGTFYENIGTTKRPAFGPPQEHPFGLQDPGFSPAFVDIDGDGDFDAFFGTSYGYVVFFRNEGTARKPAFGAAQRNPFGLTSVYERNSPAFADVDHDGDFDAIIGDRDGDNTFFENIGDRHNPAFGAEQVNPFGLTVVPGDSTPAFADLNHDGDIDLFVGNKNGLVVYFENRGSNTNPVFTENPGNPFELDRGETSFVDIDHDGDLDAFIGKKNDGVYYAENIGSAAAPLFDTPIRPPFGLDVTTLPIFTDIDNDKDPDAFIRDSNGSILYIENIGSANAPNFTSPVTNPFGLRGVRQFADIDGDTDMDAFFGNSNGEIIYQENVGSVTTSAFSSPLTNPFGLEDVGSDSRPFCADIDQDGDLDAFIGENRGNIKYQENVGSSEDPAFATPKINPFALRDIGVGNYPSLIDIDGDGSLDIFITENSDRTFFFRGRSLSYSTHLPIIIKGE